MPSAKNDSIRVSKGEIPSLPIALVPSPGPFSTHNRRASSCPVQRIYPWLLTASTCVAAVFCLLYITKPVLIPAPSIPASHLEAGRDPLAMTGEAAAGNQALGGSLLPGGDRLPGDPGSLVKPSPADPRVALGAASASNPTEETNLRIQHILTAEAPGGHRNRIDIEVPVLYQSRNLRWTPKEVAKARELLVRLMDYQEKSRSLRMEGTELLESWNRLVQNSIPASDLRADSPSLPANQQDAADLPRPASLISTEVIQIQPSGQ